MALSFDVAKVDANIIHEIAARARGLDASRSRLEIVLERPALPSDSSVALKAELEAHEADLRRINARIIRIANELHENINASVGRGLSLTEHRLWLAEFNFLTEEGLSVSIEALGRCRDGLDVCGSLNPMDGE